MKISVVSARSALSKSNLPGLDYSLNPYRNCSHGCVFCYAPNILHLDRLEWGSWVEVRQNLPNLLAHELKKKKPGVVGLSTVTDPYQPVERRFRVSRICLEALRRADEAWSVSLQTRSELILDDLKLLSSFGPRLEVLVSIGCFDEELVKRLEPGAPSVARRFEMIHTLLDAEISVGVFFGPVIPTVDLEDVEGIVKRFSDLGVSRIFLDSLHLKPGVRDALTSVLSSDDPASSFVLSNLSDKTYFEQFRKRFVKEASKKGLEILDAF